MKKTAKKNPPSKKVAKSVSTEPPTAAPPLNPMERARQRVETSRQAALNKVVCQSPE